MAGEEAQLAGMQLVEQLRQQMPTLRIRANCGGGSFKAQIKRADKSGARFALILGSNEVQDKTVTFKPLRLKEAQETIPQTALKHFLGSRL
jgi:histidyl-tRNA synthetase